DADALADVERQLQQIDERYRARSVDGVHDLLLHLGDLSAAEIAQRAADGAVRAADAIERLRRARRILQVDIARETGAIPVEYAARYRYALGVPLPVGLPESLLAPV